MVETHLHVPASNRIHLPGPCPAGAQWQNETMKREEDQMKDKTQYLLKPRENK